MSKQFNIYKFNLTSFLCEMRCEINFEIDLIKDDTLVVEYQHSQNTIKITFDYLKNFSLVMIVDASTIHIVRINKKRRSSKLIYAHVNDMFGY